MTFEEFERLPDQSGKRELLNGELIERPPSKRKHHQIAERIFLRLREILVAGHRDRAAAEAGQAYHLMGYRLEDGNWLQPDVSVTRADQGGEDYYRGAPALAVEIVSESNSAEEIAGKVETYLLNGASEVWIVYPKHGFVWVHRRSGQSEKCTAMLSSGLFSAVLDLKEVLG